MAIFLLQGSDNFVHISKGILHVLITVIPQIGEHDQSPGDYALIS